MSKKVGIVLVNYQDYAAKYLTACFACLQKQSYPTDSFNIYVVDNASSPESISYLNTNYPNIKVLTRPDGNYVAALNLGFRQAISDACEYIVSVNMDTEMENDWLSELVLALDNNPSVGIAQSKIFIYPKNDEERNNPRLNSIGNIFHFLGFGFTDAYNQLESEVAKIINLEAYPKIKGYASGCSMIMRADLFSLVGGYNEEYYMYHDDVEISLKTRLAGMDIVLAPRSVLYHKYEFSRSVKMLYYMERNRYLTMAIFYPFWLRLLLVVPNLIMNLGMLAYSLLNGWFMTELKIYRYFWRFSTYRKICQERGSLKNIKKVSFGSVARDFSGQIDFQEINNPILKYIANPALNLYWSLIKKII